MNLISLIKPQRHPVTYVLCFISTVTIGIIDYYLGRQVSFSLFYLFPILSLTWYYGRLHGYILSVASAVIWFSADMLAYKSTSWSPVSIWNAFIRLGFFLITSHLLAIIHDLLLKERNLSRVDYLTGIANTRGFFEFTEQERKRAHRYNSSFMIAYIDLDNFKLVNDTQGHEQGDTLLKTVAQTIKKNLRESDLVARLGGDEFVVLLPETEAKHAETVIKKTLSILNKTMKHNKWPVTFSVGAIVYQKSPHSIDAMIKEADNLMYNVKKSGKNALRIQVYT